MTVQFAQTGTGATCGVGAQYCSGVANQHATPIARLAEEAGSAGGAFTATMTGQELNARLLYWDILPAGDLTWAAGDWTVRINVTTGVNKGYWIGTYICRVNSSCANQETLASDTRAADAGSEVELPGVYSWVINQGSLASPSANDRVVIVCSFANDNHGNTDLGVTPNQDITAPFTRPTTGMPGQGMLVGVGQ